MGYYEYIAAFQMQQASVAFGSTLALQIFVSPLKSVIAWQLWILTALVKALCPVIVRLAPLRPGAWKCLVTRQLCRHLIAYMPQKDTVDWRFPATVADVVLMGRWCHRVTGHGQAPPIGKWCMMP